MTPSITAIVLTKNEEAHMARCIKALAPIAQRIVVVDSFSTDRTVEISKSHGAEVLQNNFVNQAVQFQWGLDHIKIDTDWVLRIDADEYFLPEAVAEIVARLPALPADVTGIEFRRRFIFRGRWLRHGRYYPVTLLRLWRKGAATIEQRWMDEHIVLTRGQSVLFKQGDFVDENLNGITAWVDKHNRYATRHMVDYINLEHHLFAEDTRILNTHRAGRRKLKTDVYARAPLYLRAFLHFCYIYFVRLGFLDGKQGFIYYVMHGFWYYVLIDAKIEDARAFIREYGLDAFKRHLADTHGIVL
jgi:glycosyltransferase involved in cell wall biosynthesis